MISAHAEPLTERQFRTLDQLAQYHRERGVAPTVRELGRRVNPMSKTLPTPELHELRRRGLVTWERGRNRTLRVTPAGAEVLSPQVSVLGGDEVEESLSEWMAANERTEPLIAGYVPIGEGETSADVSSVSPDAPAGFDWAAWREGRE